MIADPIYNYIEKELFAACPMPPADCGTLRIQMRSDHGSTKWLNVTPEEWKQIERILFQRIPD